MARQAGARWGKLALLLALAAIMGRYADCTSRASFNRGVPIGVSGIVLGMPGDEAARTLVQIREVDWELISDSMDGGYEWFELRHRPGVRLQLRVVLAPDGTVCYVESLVPMPTLVQGEHTVAVGGMKEAEVVDVLGDPTHRTVRGDKTWYHYEKWHLTVAFHNGRLTAVGLRDPKHVATTR